MLPGLRILFVITFLAVSVLIFGLGAAAYLRSAHDDFASAPWRPIETPATARVDLAPATIALLRVEPENAPALPAPTADTPLTVLTPAETTVSAETASTAPVATDAPAPHAEPTALPAPAVVESAPQPAQEITQEIAVPTPVAEPARDAAPATDETKAVETKATEASTTETQEPPPAPTVVTALTADKVEPPAKSVEEPSPVAAAPPVTVAPAAVARPAAEAPPVAAPVAAIASGADTLKAGDKSIDAAPAAKIVALGEPAPAAMAPLPIKEVKIPNPRVDPAVIEARRKRVIAQQRARARAALARRIAVARARAAAQAKAAADPFGTPANTTPTRPAN